MPRGYSQQGGNTGGGSPDRVPAAPIGPGSDDLDEF